MKIEHCPFCGGNLREDLINHEMWGETGNLHIFENVPAQVCSECGEYLLTDEVTQHLDHLIQNSKPVRTVEAPVYDFTSWTLHPIK